MIRVVVKNYPAQKCWYINELSDVGEHKGKVCYESRARAVAVARQQHPYVRIEVEE